MDASCAIDLQLHCGAGLQATKKYLEGLTDSMAAKALAYLQECEAAGDFEGFFPESWIGFWRNYYHLSDE